MTYWLLRSHLSEDFSTILLSEASHRQTGRFGTSNSSSKQARKVDGDDSMAAVRYRPLPAHKLPYGPVTAIVRQRTMTVTWRIDDRQMDPLLGLAYALSGTRMLQTLSTITATRVLITRDHSLGGDDVLIVDPGPDCIDVRVAHELITCSVARELARHSTCVLRTLKCVSAYSGLPVIGHEIHIP